MQPLFVYATVFFLAGPSHRFQDFATTFGRELRRIAQLAGLPKLYSAGALSRALRATDRPTAERLSDALLVDESGMLDLLAHPSVHNRDSQGDPWHIVDFDPTIAAFRQRDLPEGEGLGPPARRAPGVAGYTGQKRGEKRIRHLPLMHAGSALWLAYRMEEPGTSGIHSLRSLLTAARPWWPRLAATGRTVIRFDGEFGHTGGFRVCRDENLPAIGRLSRYALLERPDIQAAVAAATWRAVPSSDAAKPTEAADLGWVTLEPSPGSVDAEAGPVEVRIVLSRLRPTDGRARHGVLIDGYQVEMFGTTLPPEAWPADEVVALYRARAVIENRFAQEDREFATERTFSYHLWGQALMVSFAMALWNRLIHQAFCAKPPSAKVAPRALRPPVPDTAAPPLMFATALAEPCVGAQTPGEVSIRVETPVAVEGPVEVDTPVAVETRVAADTSRGTTHPNRGVTTESSPNSPPGETPSLAAIIATYFHDVSAQPGWTLDAEAGTLQCPQKTTFRPSYVDESKRRYHRIILTNSVGACNRCPFRSSCFGSDRTDAAKRIARNVPAWIAEKVGRELAAQRRPVQPRRAPRVILAAIPQNSTPTSDLRPLQEHTPGPYRATFPSFLAAVARRSARRALEGTATLRIQRRPPPNPSHPLVEDDRSARQHQRRPRQRPTGKAHVTLRVVAKRAGSKTHWRCE